MAFIKPCSPALGRGRVGLGPMHVKTGQRLPPSRFMHWGRGLNASRWNVVPIWMQCV